MGTFIALLPVLVPILSPIITALVEKLFDVLGVPPPKPLLPLVNNATGIVLASLAGADPHTAVIAGPVGAMIGNRIREAHNRATAATAKA